MTTNYEEAHAEIDGHISSNYSTETDETKRAMRFLLWSAVLGPDEKAVGESAQLDPGELERWADRARDQGIWKDGEVHAEWFDEENGGAALILDVLVLQGLVNRS